MRKQLLPFALLSLLLLIGACVTVKKAKPRKLRTPEIVGFNYYVIDSGMTVSLEFKEKLELDSLQLDFAVVTSNENGEGKTASENVRTTGKKLRINIDRNYFTDQAYYDSMMAGQFQFPVKLFRVEAKPVNGEVSFAKGKQTRKGVYFSQRVEKLPDGYHFSSVFDEPENKKVKLIYTRE